ncbi:VOC family protein [Aureibacter tunicatorum]|uniref:Lactoylglutathione lyase n=1 Tax=Aureibacter tunicatorum TaxID=866807 RepID=A0AAE4BRF1_9BACT|nr:VOC family protein [Aureibacter tunicatorum]MDR6237177.1 lactoylglutathione lyase [Aureibacter tunicatorum]BDD06169.1 hypothetical protein AUTU_36520 [Aureibacter tunicatorum]
MKIDHLAIWVRDLDLAKAFYEKYFNMKSGEKYINETKGFSSYFLSFENSDTRLEIMHRDDIEDSFFDHSKKLGLTHFAISLGNKIKVDELTELLRQDGYKVVGEPRVTGDGYYESVVEDAEGNWVELTE